VREEARQAFRRRAVWSATVLHDVMFGAAKLPMGQSVDRVADSMDRLADRLADHRHRLNSITSHAEWERHHAAAA